jgi:hypothetical protein
MSQEYLSAIVILVVSVLGLFKIQVENEVITSLVVGAFGLWIAIRRHGKGDINIVGVLK